MKLRALYSSVPILKNSRVLRDRIRAFNVRVKLTAITDEGTFDIWLEEDFRWNGRSGPRIIDFFIPNEGTEDDALGWLWHDACGYPDTISGQLDNEILRQYRMLRCNDGPKKAWIIWKSVDLTVNSWKAYDWSEVINPDYICNKGKIKLHLEPK